MTRVSPYAAAAIVSQAQCPEYIPSRADVMIGMLTDRARMLD